MLERLDVWPTLSLCGVAFTPDYTSVWGYVGCCLLSIHMVGCTGFLCACRETHPSVFRDRTEEWYYPQLEANKRARWILGMNETMPPNETESSLKYYGMGPARWVALMPAVPQRTLAQHA